MSRLIPLTWVTALSLCLTLVGCSSSSSNADNDSSGAAGPSCDDWKSAYCDAQLRCATEDHDTCVDRLFGADCLSTAELSSCISSLKSSCVNQPTDCGLADIADPSASYPKCKTFAEKYCNSQLSCGAVSDLDACQADAMREVGCSSVLSSSKRLDSCFAQLDSGCQAVLPDDCRGIFFQE